MRKTNFTFCLALVLHGGLFGCSTTPTVTKTKVFNYSIGDSPISEGIVITDLGKSFSIHEAAATWPALIQKTKPTFAWNGCDMMWIETNHLGQPRFILDEAYLYQPTNQPRQWVLLKHQTNVLSEDLRQESPSFFYSGCNLAALVPLRDAIPQVQNDAGERGNYAAVIGANPGYGNVYEVGWQREMSVGVAHPVYGRRIYLFRDRSNKWHFLGEGPEEGWSRGGGNTLQSIVIWDGSGQYPFDIRLRSEEVSFPTGYSADNTNRPPDLTTTNEYVLAGKFPAQLRKLK